MIPLRNLPGSPLLDAVRHEWLFQRRSLRFRAAVVAYLVLVPAPALAIFFLVRPNVAWPTGFGTYVVPILETQRVFTALLAIALAGHRLDPRGLEELWPVLSASRVSSLGLVLRRTFAVVMVALPVTALPPLAAVALTLASGQTPGDPRELLLGWALFVVPVLVVVTALWTGLVLVAGGELGALVLGYFGIWIVELLGEQWHSLGGPTIRLHGDWLGRHDFEQTVRYLLFLARGSTHRQIYDRFAATDAPIEISHSLAWLGSRMGLVAGLGVLLLAVAPSFLGRTRRDLRPLVVRPDHPLRNMLRWVHVARQRYAPDGGLYVERLGLVAGGLGFAAILVGLVGHERDYRNLVEERYAAEITGATQSVTSPDVLVESWRIGGILEESGRLRTAQEGTIVNRGDTSTEVLAFTLDPFLEIANLEVADHAVEVERAWDRLFLRLDPSLDPGATATLRFDLAGRPADPWLNLHGWRVVDSFARKIEALRAGAWQTRENDHTLSRRQLAVTRRRVKLDPGDLVPAPRYTSWELTPPPESELDPGLEVPNETIFPATEIEVDLRVAGRWLLADTCGHVSDAGRLAGRCREALARYRVSGGLFERLETPDAPGIVIAALPEHLDAAREHVDSFASVVRLSGEAWPGVPPIERLAVVERPPDFHPSNLRGVQREAVSVQGRRMEVDESRLVSPEPFDLGGIIGALLGEQVTDRRAFHPDEAPLLDTFFASVMARRMGLARSGAAISESPFNRMMLRMPILEAESFHRPIFSMRVPAVVAALEGRLGRRALFAGAEDFLSRETDEPGTFRELFDALEKRSGRDLDRFYRDHFEEGVVPELLFEDVAVDFLPGGRWRVRGALRNQGTGEVECPVEARAESQEVEVRVRVDGGEATPFELLLDRRPRLLALDPEITCYRLRHSLSDRVERVSLREGG